MRQLHMKQNVPTHVQKTVILSRKRLLSFLDQQEMSLELSLGSDSASGTSVEINKDQEFLWK